MYCMKTKINKESRNLLIGLLLGDGTISNNYVFKLSHCEQQRDYLEWKIKLLGNNGIRTNGVKEYISTCGYNSSKKVLYTQLSIIPFIKVLRRVFYRPKKILGNRKLLNRLSAQEIAIWYMDDGCINIRKSKNKIHGFYIRIATCLPEKELQVIIDYFKEVWNISFYKISEGKGTYSLCCGTKEGIKFINIVKPYVQQVPSMIHKIQYNLSQRTKPI
jgi:hypothetical protein